MKPALMISLSSRLDEMIVNKEIEKGLFSIGFLKASRADGVSDLFY